MPRIPFVDGFTGQPLPHGFDCPQGSGTVACYPLFDGVTAMLLHLEAPGFWESRRSGMRWRSISAPTAGSNAPFLPGIT